MKKQTMLILLLAATICSIGACNSSTTTDETKDTTASTAPMMADSSKSDMKTTDEGMMKPMSSMMEKMDSTKLTGDFDNDYAALMIEHHQGAVDLSEMEVSKGTDEAMKKIAATMITDHKTEIGQLQKFISDHNKLPAHKHDIESDHKHEGGDEGDLSTTMKTEMGNMTSMQLTGNPDKDYAMMMKAHHEDAIKMSKGEIDHGHHAELKQMAQKMIDDDSKEVKEFENYLSGTK